MSQFNPYGNFDQIANHEKLSSEDEKKLARLIKKGGAAGEAATEKFIRCNVKLVIKIATD